MTPSDIRSAYLDFMAEKGHKIIPSSSLLPENDPTTLFTGSGMQPMLPYLLGESHPLGVRIADSQCCFRAVDTDEVGDNRHTTFFEMLGNWSLGDYFRDEQINWMWEFLIQRLELDPTRLYFTCFQGHEDFSIPRDTQSAELWQQKFAELGIDAQIGDNPEQDGIKSGQRIFYYDASKNWWSRSGNPENMPVGEPGGPDTEMFWDLGVEHSFHEHSAWAEQPCHVNCDCGRFIEIGNNVLMEYKRTEDGVEELPAKNVDFGGGLERLMLAVHDTPNIFDTPVFQKQVDKLEHLLDQAASQH